MKVSEEYCKWEMWNEKWEMRNEKREKKIDS